MDRLLRESGVDFAKVNYYNEPLTKRKLTELVRKMKTSPRELLRTGEAIYKELGLAKLESKMPRSFPSWWHTLI
jgi:arsenate reductase (glutaredoxin)